MMILEHEMSTIKKKLNRNIENVNIFWSYSTLIVLIKYQEKIKSNHEINFRWS